MYHLVKFELLFIQCGGTVTPMENKQQCMELPIEILNLSLKALDGLSYSGVTIVGELVEFFEQTWGGRGGTVALHPKTMPYVDEIVSRLKAIGCWPDTLD